MDNFLHIASIGSLYGSFRTKKDKIIDKANLCKYNSKAYVWIEI